MRILTADRRTGGGGSGKSCAIATAGGTFELADIADICFGGLFLNDDSTSARFRVFADTFHVNVVLGLFPPTNENIQGGDHSDHSNFCVKSPLMTHVFLGPCPRSKTTIRYNSLLPNQTYGKK